VAKTEQPETELDRLMREMNLHGYGARALEFVAQEDVFPQFMEMLRKSDGTVVDSSSKQDVGMTAVVNQAFDTVTPVLLQSFAHGLFVEAKYLLRRAILVRLFGQP
jgi:hypothetical protein